MKKTPILCRYNTRVYNKHFNGPVVMVAIKTICQTWVAPWVQCDLILGLAVIPHQIVCASCLDFPALILDRFFGLDVA